MAHAVTPTYELKAKNFTMTAPNVVEFDIYLKFTNPSATDFEYAVGQYVFNYNPAFANGGTLAYTYAAPQQTDFPSQFTYLIPRNPAVNTSLSELRLAPNSAPGTGSGYLIPDPGTSDGFKIIRMKLTTSACSFNGTISNSGIAWRTVNQGGYYTKIKYYDNTQINPNVDITSSNPAHYLLDINTQSSSGIVDVIVNSSTISFPNLKSAFDEINANPCQRYSGQHVVVLINANTTENAVAQLNSITPPFLSCEIRPSAEVSVTASVSMSSLVELNGPDIVTIDGRIGGAGPIKLTLDANSLAQSCITFVNGASDNNIRYTNSVNAVDKNIFLSATNSTGNDRNTIEQCVINRGNRGTSFTGNRDNPPVPSVLNSNNKALYNKIINIKDMGINITVSTRDNTIEGNEIYFETNVPVMANAFYGILCTASGTNNILKNSIHNIKSSQSGTTYCIGIFIGSVGPGAAVTNNCFNNFLSLIDDNIGAGYIYGIFSSSNGGFPVIQTTKVNHNTVFIGTEGGSANGFSFGLYMNIGIAGATYEQYNNISINERLGSQNFTFGYDKNPNVTINADYNCYWAKNLIARWSTNPARRNLPSYQCDASPNEQNSIFKDVNFLNESAGDLHLDGVSIGDYDLIGKTGLGIAGDFDLPTVRSSITPYMGADEGTPFNLYGRIRVQAFIDGIPLPNVLPVNATIEIRDNDGNNYPHLAGSPFNITYTASGTATINCPAALTPPSGTFYIVLKRPGCLDTWSKSGGETMSTIANTYLNYNFTSVSANAFCENMKEYNCKYYIYNGDVNSDGLLDDIDHADVINDALPVACAIIGTNGLGTTGIPTPGKFTDINNDGIVNCGDMLISDENQTWYPIMSNIPKASLYSPTLPYELVNRPAGLFNGTFYDYRCEVYSGFIVFQR